MYKKQAVDYCPLYNRLRKWNFIIMNINQFFGNKISLIRQEQGMSQEKLALDANIDRTYISDIEKGKRNVSLEVAYKISKALNIHISELLSNYNG